MVQWNMIKTLDIVLQQLDALDLSYQTQQLPLLSLKTEWSQCFPQIFQGKNVNDHIPKMSKYSFKVGLCFPSPGGLC